MKKITTLLDARQDQGILIATHRGMVAGNIPHNSIPAFEAALNQGTDILETDVTMSQDGVIFIFHPGQEKNQLMLQINFRCLFVKPVAQSVRVQKW
jgi:glycerophosphoryl diester phosphodiesterase